MATDYTADANCVGAWLFEEGSGTSAADSSGDGNNLTFTSSGHPAWDSDVPKAWLDYSLSFDGGTDQAYITSNLAITSHPCSAVFWVYLSSNTLQGAFLNIGDVASPGGDGFGVGVGDASNFETVGDTGNNLIVLYNNVRWVPTGDNIGTGWHHIAVVLNASGYPEVYLDGTSVYSDTTGAPATNFDNYFYLGGYVTGSYDRHPLCKLAEVGMFSRVLTSTEVPDIFTNGLKQATTATGFMTAGKYWGT